MLAKMEARLHSVFSASTFLGKYLFFYSAVLAWITHAQEGSNNLPCPDVEHVCGSLMKVTGVTTYEEGNYCSCNGCEDPFWDEEDDRAFTWYHHERSDWKVQYRFCEPIIPKQTCRSEREMAAVIRTDTEGWHPRIRKLYCRCPKNKYFLQGWHLVDGKFWDYHYTCERRMCEMNEVCVRQYLDYTKEKTTGYRFLCACPEGVVCPTTKPDLSTVQTEGSDDDVPYVQGFCRKSAAAAKNHPHKS